MFVLVGQPALGDEAADSFAVAEIDHEATVVFTFIDCLQEERSAAAHFSFLPSPCCWRLSSRGLPITRFIEERACGTGTVERMNVARNLYVDARFARVVRAFARVETRAMRKVLVDVFVLMSLCACKKELEVAKQGERTVADAIGSMATYRDRLCACKDTTCADAVFKEYVAVAEDSRDRLGKTKATPEQSEQMQEIAKELGTCKLRLQDRGTQMSEIHIEIKCSGDGFPSSAELPRRHAVEDALAEADVGQVVDAGGGMGVMDIYVDVKDVAVAMAKTKEIVKRLGLENRTTIEAVPQPD